MKAFDPKDERETEICMIWIALNSVDFWGNDEAVEHHYHLLRKYRAKVTKITGCRARDLPTKYVSSDMLPKVENYLSEIKGFGRKVNWFSGNPKGRTAS